MRDYKDKQEVLIRQEDLREEERLRKTVKGFFDAKKPEYKEQQVQTIKSVFRPELKDESLSAIFAPDE